MIFSKNHCWTYITFQGDGHPSLPAIWKVVQVPTFNVQYPSPVEMHPKVVLQDLDL